ncbi:hypothetical protein GGF37_003887 [Kickxella alabastrina]|nr:hypothetical protein GGF37_003887 [Kickxella alabastrina]
MYLYSSNSVAAETTLAIVSVPAAAIAVSVTTKTAVNDVSFTGNAQQSRNQWVPICPQSANILRRIEEEKDWSKRKISCKVKQQLRDELAERNRKHCVNLQPANNLKRIVRLSDQSRGKIERRIRQRMRDELAVQQQQRQQQKQQQ